MGNFAITVFEAIVAAVITAAGLSKNGFLFIKSPRAAVITLGIVGMLLCTISVGKFISAAPAHPLTVCGYILGGVSMIIFLTQLFKWQVPFIGDGKTALILLAVAIILLGIIGRFYPCIAK